MTPARRPLLAIGIDAAEGRLVRHLIAEGRLPSLARLVASGRWGRVASPATVGSGAVWPTFVSGMAPDEHGLFGEFAWNADAMGLERPAFETLAPFWRQLTGPDRTVAVVDVPFAPVTTGQPGLVEISDWGAHDWMGGRRVIQPPDLAHALADLLATPHPLAAGPVDSQAPGDVEGLRHVIRALLAGIRMRGDLLRRLAAVTSPALLLGVFTEAHRASHLLWHTLDTAHPVWQEGLGALPDDVMRGLVDVFAAIDDQIGRLIDDVQPSGTVVFALHGMQPARGIPAFLDRVLEAWGVAAPRRLWQRSPGEHAASVARGAKRLVPSSLKAAYYQRVPRTITMQLAQPSMPMAAWDWSRTRALSLPTDQHGWIRLNLAGREARGLVPADAYDETCRDLRDRLLDLASPEGRLVRDVLLPAAAIGRPPRHLPDLVVHWTEQTWRSRLRILDPPMDTAPIGLKFVGQHDDDGFYLGSGAAFDAWPETVEAAGLGRLIGASMNTR